MKGPDPVDNAGERRIPRGGSLQESEFRVWPAAIDPQTPTVPGAKRPPGFSHRGGVTRGAAWHGPPVATRPGVTTRVTLRGEEDTGGDQALLGPG